MALNQLDISEHLRPLSELDSYTVEKGDPDPRGWTVVGADGRRIGTVADLLVDTEAMKVRRLIVDLDVDTAATSSDSRVALNIDDVDVRHDTREVFARLYTGGGSDAGAGAYASSEPAATERDHATLTRAEEELRIGKREVSRGEARIGKHVETERISEPVTRRREEVVVERRPVEAGSRADASITDDEVRIPLHEEEVIVEKRPVVKEELVVGKRTVEEHDVVEAEVRREEFDIDKNVDVTSPDGSRRRGDR